MRRNRRAKWVPLVVVALVAVVFLFGYVGHVGPWGSPTGAAFTVGHDPSAITVDPMTHHVFVLNYGDGTISMIDTRHDPTVRSLTVGGSTAAVAYDLAVASAAGRVFVSDGGDAVRVLDAASGRLVRTIHLSPLIPSFLAVDERTARVFVSETGAANIATGHTVSVLDARTGAWVRRVSAGQGAGPLVVDEGTDHVFVQDLGASTVVMLNARTGAPLRTIALGGHSILSQAHLIGGPLPALIAVDAAISRVFVARYGAVAVLDTHTGALLRTTRVGHSPTAMAIDARTNRVFVANVDDNTVSVLDAQTGAPVRTVHVGHRPWALTVVTTAGRVCVANVDDNTVSILDARSGAVLRTLSTGTSPTGLAVDESLAQVYVVHTLAYSLPPPAVRRGVLGQLLQMIPFVSHWATQGSGSIPGSVSILPVVR